MSRALLEMAFLLQANRQHRRADRIHDRDLRHGHRLRGPQVLEGASHENKFQTGKF